MDSDDVLRAYRSACRGTRVAAIVWFLAANLAAAATRHYPGSFASLQEAFNACEAGDTLLIAPGFYDQPQHRRVSHSGPAFTVLSEAGPEQTVFDLGYAHYWLQLNGVGAPSQRMVLAGITVQNFRDPLVYASLACNETTLTMERMVFRDNPDVYFGSGASLADGDIECVDCVFRECYECGLILVRSTYDLSRCLFINNLGISNGAGAMISQCNGTIRDSQFIGNLAGDGGGLAIINSGSAELDGLLFSGNEAGGWGGAIEVATEGQVTLRNSVLVGNRAGFYGGAIGFNGVWDVADRLVVENCDFIGNWSQHWGSAITAYSNAELHVVGCTIVGNETEEASPFGAAILSAIGSPFYLEQSIVANTVAGSGIRVSDPAEVSIACSNVWGNANGNYASIADPTGTAGNISVDPQFCGSGGADSLALMNTSPCLPANNSCGVLIGNHGQGCEAVAAENRSWGSIKALY
ncbi:hypothetical protein FJ251_10745 [bacterium]|nr:hypothetical protein [bacterium]